MTMAATSRVYATGMAIRIVPIRLRVACALALSSIAFNRSCGRKDDPAFRSSGGSHLQSEQGSFQEHRGQPQKDENPATSSIKSLPIDGSIAFAKFAIRVAPTATSPARNRPAALFTRSWEDFKDCRTVSLACTCASRTDFIASWIWGFGAEEGHLRAVLHFLGIVERTCVAADTAGLEHREQPVGDVVLEDPLPESEPAAILSGGLASMGAMVTLRFFASESQVPIDDRRPQPSTPASPTWRRQRPPRSNRSRWPIRPVNLRWNQAE